jgi:hypothetical protein
MLRTILIVTSWVLFSIQGNEIKASQLFISKAEIKDSTVLNTADWIQQLTRLRDALVAKKRDTVKSYFNFPISDKGNDIWYMVDSRYAASLPRGKVHYFKEADFDNYYIELFGIDFIKTLASLDLTELNKKSVIQSAKLTIVPGALSQMKVSMDKTKKLLILEIITEGKEFGRFSFQYHFQVINNSALVFKKIVSVFNF